MEPADAPEETPATEEPQQLQQQQTGTPVVFVQITATVVSTLQGHREWLRGVCDQGRLWERSNEMPAGEWHEIERPTR